MARFRNERSDSVDESIPERSDSELGSSCSEGSVRFEPRGSRCTESVTVEEKLTVDGISGSSAVVRALLFASCLVSKGVGVDGVRDSLVVYDLTSRHDCRCQKKSERLACHASLTNRTADRTIVSLLQG